MLGTRESLLFERSCQNLAKSNRLFRLGRFLGGRRARRAEWKQQALLLATYYNNGKNENEGGEVHLTKRAKTDLLPQLGDPGGGVVEGDEFPEPPARMSRAARRPASPGRTSGSAEDEFSSLSDGRARTTLA